MPRVLHRLLLAGLALLPLPAAAQPTLADILPNFVGAGFGFAPAYVGSKDLIWGAVPGGRVSLGGERFLALNGPVAEMNLLDHPVLQAGPIIGYRFGRSDAEDRAVRALGDVDPVVELGGRFGVSWLSTTGPVPFRLRAGVALTGDVTGQFSGVQVLPSASLWVPISPSVFVGTGVFARFATASHNRYFYGVSEAGAAASGLPAFSPKAGLTSFSAWPAVVWRVNERWAVGGGLLYTRLADEVADSPIIRRGTRDQIIGGIGIAYTW